MEYWIDVLRKQTMKVKMECGIQYHLMKIARATGVITHENRAVSIGDAALSGADTQWKIHLRVFRV